MSSQVKVCLHGQGVYPVLRAMSHQHWNLSSRVFLVAQHRHGHHRWVIVPMGQRVSPHRVQNRQFHISIDIVARVFLVTRFMPAFCRSRHTNGPEAFSSLHALRSSIHFGIGFVVQRLFWHAIYAWVSRIGLLPGGPTEFAFQDDHVHI